jgi:hypothetical protein
MTELVREVKHLFHSVRDLEWNFVKSSFYFFLPSSHTLGGRIICYMRGHTELLTEHLELCRV